MSRRATWALPTAVGLHGASLLLDPLLLFRACAAGLDSELGYLLAVLAPAAAALGAAIAGPHPTAGAVERLARRGSVLSMVAVAARVLGVLLLAWLAQSTGSKEPLPLWLGPALGVVWAAAFAASGGALVQGIRLGIARVGRVGYAELGGAALGALLIPLWMDLGTPRALILAAMLPAAAAIALATMAHPDPAAPAAERAPSWSVLVTFPLVLGVLLAGDIGQPWLRIPAQNARRATGGTLIWTTEGLIAAPKPTPRQLGYWVDDSELIPLASLSATAPKPTASPGDLAFGLGDASQGPALVIGSGGGTEVKVALAAGHEPVDAVELHPTVVRQLALGALGEQTGYFFAAAEKLRVFIGDGRTELPTAEQGYARIVVVGVEPFVPAAPRLLTWAARAYTREAIVTLLDRLAPNGVLAMVRPVAQLPALVATTRGALGQTPEDSRHHLIACSVKDSALLLVRREPWGRSEQQRIAKLCRKRRMQVHTLGAAAPPGPEPSATEAESEAAEEPTPLVDVPIVATDDRPFFGPLIPFSELPAAVLRDLARAFVVPEPSTSTAGEAVGTAASAASESIPKASAGAPATARPGKRGARPDVPPAPAKPVAAGPPATAAVRGIGILWATVLFVGLLVAATVTLGRRQRAAHGATVSLARQVQLRRIGWALLPLGAALGWSELGTVELAVRLLGHPIYGWAVAIPVSLAALASGRLLLDVVPIDRLRRVTDGVFGAAVLVLVVLFATGFRASALDGAAGWVTASFALAALTAQGLVLGAAFCALLRTLVVVSAAEGPAAGGGLGRAWASHCGGWALGAASGALVARHVGTQALLLLAAAAVLVSAVIAGRPRGGGLPRSLDPKRDAIAVA